MSESKLPPTIVIPQEHHKVLEQANIKPMRGEVFMTFALISLFEEFEKKEQKRRKTKKKEQSTPENPYWLPLYLFLRPVFEELANQTPPEQPPKPKKAKREKPEPSDEPMYDNLEVFAGRPITPGYGPYALPTGIFNALRWDLYTSHKEPKELMADEIAELSEVEILAMKNIDEKSLRIIRALLDRIEHEVERGPHLVEIPSLYYGVFAKQADLPYLVVEQLRSMISVYNPEVNVIHNGFVDLYTLACFSDNQFTDENTLAMYGQWGKQVFLELLEAHADDIYLKK